MSLNLSHWSINRRLILAGLLLIPLSLMILGVGYFVAANNSAQVAQRQYMQLAVYWLLANADITPEGGVEMGPLIEEPRLANPQSGFYALITDTEGTIYWRSASSVAMSLDGLATDIQNIPFGQDDYEAVQGSMAHYRRPVKWELLSGEQVELVFHVFEEKNWVDEQLAAYQGVLQASYVATTVVLIAVLLLIVRWGLRPMAGLVSQLHSVERGQTRRIEGAFPRELDALIAAINQLLGNEQQQRERYRSAQADLSHSLKTPLSVLRNDAQSLTGEARQSAEKAIARMQEIIDYQLQRAAIQSAESLVKTQVDLYVTAQRVAQSLAKVYLDKKVVIRVEGQSQRVMGDERDLMDMVGNLTDNACKAAASQVLIKVSRSDDKVQLCVEDDGPGIDASMLDDITQRGHRADQYDSGHGIGLAVVSDIVASMKGQMALTKSDLGGARFEVSLPCPEQQG